MYWECVWGGSAPRSVFDEDVVKAGCLDDVLGGRDPPCAGPHPDVLLTHIKPLRVVVASYSVTAAIPLAGFVNSHSHAFQRALRGRAAGTDFWTWRDGMLEEADRATPDSVRDHYTDVYLEMRAAGYTAVGEFHYLGAAEAFAAADAAAAAGITIVLLHVAYERGGLERMRQPSVAAVRAPGARPPPGRPPGVLEA